MHTYLFRRGFVRPWILRCTFCTCKQDVRGNVIVWSETSAQRAVLSLNSPLRVECRGKLGCDFRPADIVISSHTNLGSTNFAVAAFVSIVWLCQSLLGVRMWHAINGCRNQISGSAPSTTWSQLLCARFGWRPWWARAIWRMMANSSVALTISVVHSVAPKPCASPVTYHGTLHEPNSGYYHSPPWKPQCSLGAASACRSARICSVYRSLA